MKINELAKVIKDKYPEYKDVEDSDLVASVIEKYPEYRENLDKSELAVLEAFQQLIKHPTQNVIGENIRAGAAGLGELITGKGLQKSAETIEKVQEGEKPSTTAGKVGEFVGSMVTPEQIALQAVGGAALEASGIGTWATNFIKEWGEKAALFAIGSIKKIAEMMGNESLPALAQFLLNPVKLGAKEFPAIIRATSSPEDMLKSARVIQTAAGKVLEKINPVVDDAINADPSVINLKGILDELYKMRDKILRVSPNTSAPDIAQFTRVISDYEQILQKWMKGEVTDLFTLLRELKTNLGQAVFRFGPEVQSKAAIGDSYKVIAEGIDAASKSVSPAVGQAFAEANEVYTKVSAVVDALQGKVNKMAEHFFSGFAKSIGTLGALAGFGVKSLVTGPAAFMTAKAAEKYGPQAVAAGLSAVAPAVGPAIAKGIPLAANAIQAALRQ